MVGYSASVIRDEVQRSERLSRWGLGGWLECLSLFVGWRSGILLIVGLGGYASGRLCYEACMGREAFGTVTLRVEEHAYSLCRAWSAEQCWGWFNCTMHAWMSRARGLRGAELRKGMF